MTEKEIYDRLNEVFRDVFDDATLSVTASTTAADVAEWDSLIHITLMQAVEDEFGIRFAMKEVTGLHNVGELASIIAARAN